jgi:predicted ATPase/DNA-binding winged helix-turn-helix (wHTH) protein
MDTEPHVFSLAVRLDAANQCVWRDRVSIPLTPKSFTVLSYLMERSGQLVTKEELLNAAWPSIYVSDAALKVCIRRLRQALGDQSHPPRYIETVHWRGYRFIGQVTGSTELSLVSPALDRPLAHHEVGVLPAPERLQSDSYLPPFPLDSATEIPDDPPLVGRDAELQHLSRCFEKIERGNRHTLFITGPPGIGKTAIVDAFLAEVGHNQRLWIAQGQCIEHYGAGESYLPVLDALYRLCRLPGGESLLSGLRRYAPMWLAQLPSLLTPTERKDLRRELHGSSRERMLREMAEAIEVLTADAPLILVLEDLHWSDHATLDLLSFLARRRESARLLMLCVYRPEELARHSHPLKNLKHDLQTHRHCEELTITPLSPEMISSYLDARFPRHTFPLVLAAQLHRRTDGNPLFLVNMVDHLVARGAIASEEQLWRVQGALEDIQTETPASIQQIVETQIDRLEPEERRILEVASVAGMDFSSAAVAAGMDADIAEVETYCEELARRGQFLRTYDTEEWPDATVAARYEFMHSLYQQVWYERVSAGRRARLHQRIGERYENAYGNRVREIAAELAIHFEHGRDFPRAIRYRYFAAENAARRFGYQEAITHLTKGLDLLSTQPATAERDQQEIILQCALGAACLAIHGFAAPEVGKAYARARSLCQQREATSILAPALHSLWFYYFVRAELATAKALAEQFGQLAQREQSPALQLEADRELGQTLYFLGALPQAREHLERNITRYDANKHDTHIFLYGQDPGVVSLAQNARTLCLLGYLDQAVQQAEAAITLAKKIEHPYSLALAQYHAAMVHHARRDVQRTRATVEASVALSPEHGLPYWLSLMQVLKGWTFAHQGDYETGIHMMQQGLLASQEAGATLNHPYSLVLLAEAYGTIGKIEQGLRLLGEAQQSVEWKVGYCYQAEMFRLQGELTLQQEAQDWKTQFSSAQASVNSQASSQVMLEAEGYFLKALEVARGQQARLFELRAVVSLSRLWNRQGKKREAYNRLATVYAWFTEGLDSIDLQEAQALLNELF